MISKSSPRNHYTASVRSYLGFARKYARETLVNRRQGTRPPIPARHRPDLESWADTNLTAAWLGHATVLLNFFGTWVITDPVLAKRIGIRIAGITLGPRRLTQPALRVRDLPRLDLILVSHAHMDHLDLATLAKLPRTTRVITHRGVGDLLHRFHQVSELAWGEAVMHGNLRIEGIGAKHWGARTLTDHQRGFGGFLLENQGRRILYSGDTAYTELYGGYGAKNPIDLAILPIGAYDPWIHNHANPEEAWSMSREMNARYVMPIHHSTFRLSREPMNEPLRRFLTAAAGEAERIVGRELGETFRLKALGGEDKP
jgi:L-ascorbate metabolism protein UlaG (beta-lactamase superfamily)